MNATSRFLSSLSSLCAPRSALGVGAVVACAIVGACSTTDAGGAGTGGADNAGGTNSTAAGTTSSTAGTSPGAGAGTVGAGGGSAGTAAASGGSGGGYAVGMGVACPTPAPATTTLLDFALVDGGTTMGFGDFTTNFSGSVYSYPAGIVADLTGANWHLSGMVGDYSGFGVAFKANATDCTLVDMSAFGGISFTIKGSVAAPGAAANTVTLTVGTAGDDVNSNWLNAHKMLASDPDAAPTFGRCVPKSTNRYDGSCNLPSFTVPVTAAGATVTVHWADLAKGTPGASVTPSEITSLAWSFPFTAPTAPAVAVPYAADITVDDIALIAP